MADTRRHILEVAGEIFAEKGFQTATVREICQRAGVNLASVNYYFGDKERLYIDAVKFARQLREEQEPLPDWSPTTPPDEKLRMFIRTMARRILSRDAAPWQLRLIVREIMEPTKACEEMVQEAFEPYFQKLVDVLRELMPADTPPYRLRQIGFSIFGQCVYYRVHDKIVSMLVPDDELAEHFGPDQLADHIIDLTLAAVGAAPPLAEQRADVDSAKLTTNVSE